eukprot:4822590-Alexandrium_andersonii.AAC.1
MGVRVQVSRKPCHHFRPPRQGYNSSGANRGEAESFRTHSGCMVPSRSYKYQGVPYNSVKHRAHQQSRARRQKTIVMIMCIALLKSLLPGRSNGYICAHKGRVFCFS